MANFAKLQELLTKTGPSRCDVCDGAGEVELRWTLHVPRHARQEVVRWPWHLGHNVPLIGMDGCVDDQDYNDGAQNDHPIG